MPNNGEIVVGEAADGHDGIPQVLELRPDILILDLMLPKLDGLEMLRQIQRIQIPRKVVLTAQISQEVLMKASKLGGRWGRVEKKAGFRVATEVHGFFHDCIVVLCPEVFVHSPLEVSIRRDPKVFTVRREKVRQVMLPECGPRTKRLIIQISSGFDRLAANAWPCRS